MCFSKDCIDLLDVKAAENAGILDVQPNRRLAKLMHLYKGAGYKCSNCGKRKDVYLKQIIAKTGNIVYKNESDKEQERTAENISIALQILAKRPKRLEYLGFESERSSKISCWYSCYTNCFTYANLH